MHDKPSAAKVKFGHRTERKAGPANGLPSLGKKMAKILISYRREDSAYPAGIIRDQLAGRFGRQNVFIDIDSIPFGQDFRHHISREVESCDYLLAVIGRSWLSVHDAAGQRRLDDPSDFVRLEIEAALARDIPVIPVLLDNVSPPKPEELPASLGSLAYRNAISIRPPPDLPHDIEKLADSIAKQDKERLRRQRAKPAPVAPVAATQVESSPAPVSSLSASRARSRRNILIACAVAAVAIVAVVLISLHRGTNSDVPREDSDIPAAPASEPPTATAPSSSPAPPPPAPTVAPSGSPPAQSPVANNPSAPDTGAPASGEAQPLHAPFDANTAGGAQVVWASNLKLASALETNSIGMKLILIPPGDFMMGSPESENGRSENEKQHQVQIAKPFFIGIDDVTRGNFLAFYHDSGYKTEAETDGKGGYGLDEHDVASQKPEYTFLSWGRIQTDSHPVVNVSWNDANAFCDWLSKKEEKKYRLPTEAEWEYACRAGTQTPFNFGSSINGEQANCDGRKPYGTDVSGPFLNNTTPVGSYKPNAFGLYDMHGNAGQWCDDWYGADYQATSPADNAQLQSDKAKLALAKADYERALNLQKTPGVISQQEVDSYIGALRSAEALVQKETAADSSRVIRGSSWFSKGVDCRSASRVGKEPAYRYFSIGFRVVREP